jgi:hypothetical protein
MHRRMEDKIRQLCEQATAEEDSAKLGRILVELRSAIHQHIGRLRTKLATYPVGVERRDRKPELDSGNS